MAPLCADPRQIVITLNPARRQALLKLVHDITAHMISQLQTPSEELGSVALEDEGDAADEDARQGESPNAHRPEDGGSRTSECSPAPVDRATKEAEKIQTAALKYTLEWRDEVVLKLQEIVSVEDTPKILSERKSRREATEKRNQNPSEAGDQLRDAGEIQIYGAEAISALQAVYRPIQTRLTSISLEDREVALGSVLLLILSTGRYSAHSRALVLYLASSLELPQTFLDQEEVGIARSLMESATADKSRKEAMSADAEAAKRQEDNKFSRFWKVGLASVAGAAVIGVTGGLAAPLVAGAIGGIMGGVGLGGVASFLGIFWMNGALVGALFGAYGAKMTGEMVDHYAKEVEDFRFLPLEDDENADIEEAKSKQQKQQRRLRVTIGINGWLNSEVDIKKPWRVLGSDTEAFALRYEMKVLLALGSALHDLIQSFAWKTFKSEIIKRTVLATLWAALWPLQILSVASNVDNPFNRASNRSQKAGQLLADALINRVQGERPVTLVGYSLGATAIHACLQSLAERHAFGLVDTVVIIGTPAPSDSAHWRTIRTVVSGKIFNVYSENDMILGFVYRMHSLTLGIAGLQPIKGVQGVENLDLSERVSGHLRYASLTGEILRKCGFVSVNAGDEIEKDDVIMLKEQHAKGELVSLDDSAVEPQQKREEASVHKMGEDLRGLTVSPTAPTSQPALAGSPRTGGSMQHTNLESSSRKIKGDETNPPLPRRPAQEMPLAEGDVTSPPLPRRPALGSEQGDAINNKPPRPLTPESNFSDHGEYKAVTMLDWDDDDEHI